MSSVSVDGVTAVDACHLVAPGAVAAETAPEAAADNPCPAGALSALHHSAFAHGAATSVSTLNMNDSRRHVLRNGLVAVSGRLTVVNWLGGHVHRGLLLMHHGRRGHVDNWCLVVNWWLIMWCFSVMCHCRILLKKDL